MVEGYHECPPVLRRYRVFSAKNAFVTAYLLELSQTRFNAFCCFIYSYCVFTGIQTKSGNILLLLSSSASSSMKESQKFMFSGNVPSRRFWSAPKNATSVINPWEGLTPEVRDSRTSHHSAHAQSQV